MKQLAYAHLLSPFLVHKDYSANIRLRNALGLYSGSTIHGNSSYETLYNRAINAKTGGYTAVNEYRNEMAIISKINMLSPPIHP